MSMRKHENENLCLIFCCIFLSKTLSALFLINNILILCDNMQNDNQNQNYDLQIKQVYCYHIF